MRVLLFVIAAQFLVPQVAGGSEAFLGLLNMVLPEDVTLYGVVLDMNNRPNTTLQVKVCWDDPTFTNNCDKSVTANTTGFPYTLCSAGAVCHGFLYTPPRTPVGNVMPRDGKDHLMYAKVLSQENPGSGDKQLDGSPWPFTFKKGNVAPMWTPNLEASPDRLTASQLAIFANSQDPYSVGSSGTTVCTVGGAAIKDDGVVGYYVQKHKVPCGNVFVVSLSTAAYVAQATLESTVLAVRLPADLQAIALGWVAPAQVSSTLSSDGPRSISAVVANGGWMKGAPSTCTVSGGPSAQPLLGQGPINPYFNKASKAPFTDYKFRPTMLLAGETCPACAKNSNTYVGPWLPDVSTAKITIDAAIAAVDTNPTGGNVYWAYTADPVRNQTVFIVSPLLLGSGLSPKVNTQILGTRTNFYPADITSKNILLYDEGAPHWNYQGATFLPGAGIGFAVTSTSGYLPYDGNQTNVASWLQAGAVAAYGNAIEPCNLFAYKHPDPAILVSNYLQGQTVVEALWKSVRLPWGGNFVGDPLASPFSLGPSIPRSGPRVSPGGAVNGASFAPGPVSPGTVLTVFGSNLGPQTVSGLQLDNSGHVAVSSGGTRVLINGVPAPIIYSLEGQVSAIVPFGTQTNAPAQVVVEYNGEQSPAELLSTADTSPALFTVNASGKGQGAILNQSGTLNGPDNPAAKGSVVVLYATGAGITSPLSVDGEITAGVFPKPVQPVIVLIGGQQAVLNYAGAAPGLVAGVLQVNAVIPAGVGSGDQSVVLQVGSVTSPTGVTVAVE